MTDKPLITFDLNEGLSKALIDKFFEPTTQVVGFDPGSGMVRTFEARSPLAVMAGLMFDQHAREILDKVWQRIDKDQLADLVAASVVKAYTDRPDVYRQVTPEQVALHARILEIVAQTLGQRVVDRMDVQLSNKPAIEPGDTDE